MRVTIAQACFLYIKQSYQECCQEVPNEKGTSGAPTSVKLNIFDAVW